MSLIIQWFQEFKFRKDKLRAESRARFSPDQNAEIREQTRLKESRFDRWFIRVYSVFS
jgi:hypothetical protein